MQDRLTGCSFCKRRVNEQWLIGRLSRLFARCSRIEKVRLSLENGEETLAVTETMGGVIVEELVIDQLTTLSRYAV